jgi:hypothetical protein
MTSSTRPTSTSMSKKIKPPKPQLWSFEERFDVGIVDRVCDLKAHGVFEYE